MTGRSHAPEPAPHAPSAAVEGSTSESLLDRVEPAVDAASVLLSSGRRVELEAGPDVDRLIVRARGGQIVLRIAVGDDGPGIPPEHLERVFERFHRVDESRARERGGTGLGLAIARAIVEAHRGRIRAESPPGGGTTITLELPGYQPAGDAGVEPTNPN